MRLFFVIFKYLWLNSLLDDDVFLLLYEPGIIRQRWQMLIHNVKLGVSFSSLLPSVRGRVTNKSCSFLHTRSSLQKLLKYSASHRNFFLYYQIKYGSDGNDHIHGKYLAEHGGLLDRISYYILWLHHRSNAYFSLRVTEQFPMMRQPIISLVLCQYIFVFPVAALEDNLERIVSEVIIIWGSHH